MSLSQSLLNRGKTKKKKNIDEIREVLIKVGLLQDTTGEKKRNLNPGRWIKEIINAVIDTSQTKNPGIIFNAIFGKLIYVFPGLYNKMRRNVEMAGIKILPETYFSYSIGFSIISALLVMFNFFFITKLLGIKLFLPSYFVPLIPFFIGVLCFLGFYLYPMNKIMRKKLSIDTNLTFALSHMAAITTSGVPPYKTFEMLSEFTEYGGICEEARNIVKRVRVFGEDITSAIRYVARRTPSDKLKELLFGMLSIIESGGNLKEYLSEMADRALFTYRLEREKYVQTLSTFADIYTALLVIAPLMLVVVFSIMNIVPISGGIMGFSMDFLMKLGIYVLIPSMNIIFLLVLSVIQPEI